MKLTKENLIDWIDRPPSNSDLDLINYIIGLQNNRDKAIEEIDNLLVYDNFSDTTKGFGNVLEQLKFYLSDYDTLEDFRKSLKGDSE